MSSHSGDDALETLFLPFLTDQLNWPAEGALFLRARDGLPLHQRSWPNLVCEQTFKPDADALQRSGFVVNENSATRKYPLVLMLPPRQRDEARAMMARAIESTEPGGRVIACVANNEGARSSEADLARLAGRTETLTKNKCRVYWSGPLNGPADAQLAAEWRELDAVRPIGNGLFVSRPGLFAWDRVDIASVFLAEHFPENATGRAADLGAGFGYLTAQLLARCPKIKTVDLYEAENRALDLARQNLAAQGSRATLNFNWHDVTTGLPKTYDLIVMNPPFHTGAREDRPDIGRRFISVAAASLNGGGQLWLVANRHLPYETVLNESFGTVRKVADQHGYKVVQAIKASRQQR
jgi:16S rRNA (guanine1207-N2)-methyltransferase